MISAYAPESWGVSMAFQGLGLAGSHGLHKNWRKLGRDLKWPRLSRITVIPILSSTDGHSLFLTPASERSVHFQHKKINEIPFFPTTPPISQTNSALTNDW